MKKLAQKVKKEAARAADNIVTAVEDGTLSREAERIGQQIGKTAEKVGQQVRDTTLDAVDQGKEGIIRAQTADQREEANERQQRCATKVTTLKATLPADLSNADAELIDLLKLLDLLHAEINILAEKIRSRDQEKHDNYAFKDQITDDPKQDCSNWLKVQKDIEEALDKACAQIKAKLDAPKAAPTAALPPLALSSAAKAIFGGQRKKTTLQTTQAVQSFDTDELSSAFSAVLGSANKEQPAEEFELLSDTESVGSAPKRKLSQG